MVTSGFFASAKMGILLAHAVLVLGVTILLYGLKFYGPYSFVHLEGLALSLYGVVASVTEVLVLLAQKSCWAQRYTDFWNAFLWELHMALLVVTHTIIYMFFTYSG